MKATSKQAGAKDPASIKTFAIKLPTAMHEQLAAKAQSHGVGMQDLGVQLVDMFLADKLKLKVTIAVDNDIAAELAELAAVMADPKRAEAIMRAARSQAK